MTIVQIKEMLNRVPIDVADEDVKVFFDNYDLHFEYTRLETDEEFNHRFAKYNTELAEYHVWVEQNKEEISKFYLQLLDKQQKKILRDNEAHNKLKIELEKLSIINCPNF